MIRRAPGSPREYTRFPYTTLVRSPTAKQDAQAKGEGEAWGRPLRGRPREWGVGHGFVHDQLATGRKIRVLTEVVHHITSALQLTWQRRRPDPRGDLRHGWLSEDDPGRPGLRVQDRKSVE